MIERVASNSTLNSAGFVSAVQAFVAFTVLRWEWLTAEELALLEVPIVFASVGLWGILVAVRRRLT